MTLCHKTPKNSKTSKKNSKFHLKLQKLRIEFKKKHEQFLENIFFVHWFSFDCEGGFLLTDPRYEKLLISR